MFLNYLAVERRAVEIVPCILAMIRPMLCYGKDASGKEIWQISSVKRVRYAGNENISFFSSPVRPLARWLPGVQTGIR